LIRAARIAVFTLAMAVVAHAAAWAQGVDFSTAITSNNRVGLTTSNYGFFGNDFISRAPSFEFPLGTGFEHMVRSGLWIGANKVIVDTGTVYQRVTTGAQDALQGNGGPQGTEWLPTSVITQRSTLPRSRYYSPAAVSEQDYVCTFSDKPGRTPQFAGEPHQPLGIEVSQQMYDWSFASFANIVFEHLTLRGTANLLDSVYVGMYAEMASGPKNSYSTWPPSAAGSSLGGWYGKKQLVWDAKRRMLAEHYCENISNCHAEIVPPWVAIILLGVHPDTVSNKVVGLHLWNWSPGDLTRDQDSEKYAILSSPWQTPPDSLPPLQGANDPVELLATGPFHILPSPSFSDTTVAHIQVDYAFMGGDTYDDLLKAADFAQLAFNFNYVVPTPPPSPKIHLVTRETEMEIFWESSPESTVDKTSPQPGHKDFEGYRVYLGTDRNSLNRVAQFDKVDTTGFNTGFEAIRLPSPQVIEGDTMDYHYLIKGLRDGFKYFAAVTSYDTGDQEIESLESGITQNKDLGIPGASPAQAAGQGVTVFPNPYKVEAQWDAGTLVRDHYLWFGNLPQHSHLAIYTLAGDLVYEVNFDGGNYHGVNARGVYDPRRELDVPPPTLSGSSFAWNLISKQGQAVATGIYLYAVRDLDSGKVQRGKFLVLKSDREGF
jgi:hypothetical protein